MSKELSIWSAHWIHRYCSTRQKNKHPEIFEIPRDRLQYVWKCPRHADLVVVWYWGSFVHLLCLLQSSLCQQNEGWSHYYLSLFTREEILNLIHRLLRCCWFHFFFLSIVNSSSIYRSGSLTMFSIEENQLSRSSAFL